jgi:hypothetical protein
MAKVNKPLVIGSSLIAVIALLGYGCATSGNSDAAQRVSAAAANKAQASAAENYSSNKNAVTDSVNNSTSANGQMGSTTANGANGLGNSTLNNLAADPRIVRADIQHILQAKYQDAAELRTAMQGAAILQSYLEQPSQDAVSLLKSYDCSVISLTQADQNFIKSLTFDTPEKKSLIKNGLKNYVPPVSVEITIDSNGNAVSPCAGQ